MNTTLARRVPSLFITSIMMVAVGIFLFIGLLNRQHDLSILCILVLGIAIILRIWAKVAGKKIVCRLISDRTRIFPEENITFTLTVENHKPLPVWLDIEMPVHASTNAVTETGTFYGQQTLLWYQQALFEWQTATLKRGVYEVGPLQVLSGDLLGFFQFESTDRETAEIVVYPKIVPLPLFSLPKREFFGAPGGESPVDDPVYILGTSDYHYGRPARYIHWKASARHQRLQEKVFDSTVQEKILFLINIEGFTKAENKESFEQGLEIIASLALQFDRRGCAMGLLTNGEVKGSSSSVAVSRGSQQLARILEALARLQPVQNNVFIDILETTGAVPWGTTCLCLSLNNDDSTKIIVEYLKQRKIPVIMVPWEMDSLLRKNNPVAPEIHAPLVNGLIGVEEVQGI